MHVPFSLTPPNRRRWWLLVLIGFLVIGVIVMLVLPPVAQQAILYGGPRPKYDLFGGWVSVFGRLSDSVTCFEEWSSTYNEHAPCPTMLRGVTHSREAITVLADCLFALGYGVGGGLGAWWLGEFAAHKPQSVRLWHVTAWSLLVAGTSDLVENLATLLMIAGAHLETPVVVARAACLSKSLGVALALIATIGAGATWWLAPRPRKNGGR